MLLNMPLLSAHNMVFTKLSSDKGLQSLNIADNGVNDFLKMGISGFTVYNHTATAASINKISYLHVLFPPCLTWISYLF